MGIKWEGLIFGGIAIGIGVWELFSLRRANRRAKEREESSTPR
jgi:hypothetical protein